jgi:hypothetical protein
MRKRARGMWLDLKLQVEVGGDAKAGVENGALVIGSELEHLPVLGIALVEPVHSLGHEVATSLESID